MTQEINEKDTSRLEWLMARDKIEFLFENNEILVRVHFNGDEFSCPKKGYSGWYTAFGKTQRECIDKLMRYEYYEICPDGN